MSRVVVLAPNARARIERGQQWLAAHAPGQEVLVAGATAQAASELLRGALGDRPAAFGWHRISFAQLAAALAAPALVETDRVPVGRLGVQAVAARAVARVSGEQQLDRYRPVSEAPGFARAVAGVIEELRLAQLEEALQGAEPELHALLAAYRAELAGAGLIDWPGVLAAAARAARAGDHPLLGLPTLLLDVPVASLAERELVSALADRTPDLLVTVPEGDATTLAHLEALDLRPEPLASTAGSDALAQLQRHLFDDAALPPPAASDESLHILSAPGENRECVEIARRLLTIASGGVAFDRVAILLRSPEQYRPHLEEALVRARIPAFFARGARRPDPAGRAFLALLRCVAEGLSARRFAEYLSLGEVPDAGPDGTPPLAGPGGERWVPPDEELVPRAVAEALEDVQRERDEATLPEEPGEVPVTAGTLRAPRHWEQLLMDAAVIGGRERWARRLEGLEASFELDLAEAAEEDEVRAESIERNLADLRALAKYALPLIDTLAELPREAAWGDWLDALSALAARALRRPERVLAMLAELAPMAAIGPVPLDEVILGLSRRLQELAVPPVASRYGKVFVAPVEAARGLAFDVVFSPGLAEKLFPHKIAEEPILLDEARERLGGSLATNQTRVERERLALKLAAGAAEQRLILSYPRIDLDQSRPRVASFYALEALRAGEGKLPDFGELASRAETESTARIGWPAPARPEDAIDEAEHDLALLQNLLGLDPDEAVGTARYLLSANPHLGRALRFRARRWLRRWTPADGLVHLPGVASALPAAREAIAEHGFERRSFSPTALQNYAKCPYKFLLYAIHKLAPREVPQAIDEMDPLQRGSLVHEVQFRLLGRLQEAALLPVLPQNLGDVQGVLDETLDEVAREYHDELAPAIERVWKDAIAGIRADLREWLRRMSEDTSEFVPWRFELAFGLPGRRKHDPHSVSGAVDLACGISLRGSIDLVERRADGSLRATDHKTGKNMSKAGQIVAGGEALQPVFYALAAEKMFAGKGRVESGRLHYCTSRGGFADHAVPLDQRARDAAEAVAEIIGEALAAPFLPAAPSPRQCEWCEYNVLCGPYEERRAARKPPEPLAGLNRLRELP